MKPARTRPRIAVVRHSDDYSLDLRRETESLIEAGYDCDFFYLGRPGDAKEQTVNGVRLIRVAGSKSRGGAARYALDYATFLSAAAVAVARRHLRHRYVMIQTNTMPDLVVLTGLVPKLMGTPVLAFMQEPSPELAHTLGFGPRVVKVFAVMERLALRFADQAIAVTDDLRDRYVERGAEGARIHVVLNGSDPRHLLIDRDRDDSPKPSRPGFRVVCHGTIEDRYGHDTIIDAVVRARDQIDGLVVTITGKGTGLDDMLAHLERAGVGDVVDYRGWVDETELAAILLDSDVGIIAQKSSPYSNLVHTNKMYDYWVAGLPVLASRLTATERLFGDDVIEYFEAGDPDDLARHLVALAHDPERREQLARKGIEAYEVHGWHHQKEAYLDAVEHTIATRRRRRR